MVRNFVPHDCNLNKGCSLRPRADGLMDFETIFFDDESFARESLEYDSKIVEFLKQ